MKRLLTVGMDEIVVKREKGRIILGLDPENVLVPKIVSDVISKDKDFGGKGKVLVEAKALKSAKKSFKEYKNHGLLDPKEEDLWVNFFNGLKMDDEMYSGVFKTDEAFIENNGRLIKSITDPEFLDKRIEFTDHDDIIILEGMNFEKIMENLKKISKKQRIRIREVD